MAEVNKFDRDGLGRGDFVPKDNFDTKKFASTRSADRQTAD